jgi:glycine cleavage system protein P-like pyridoxal-binding family
MYSINITKTRIDTKTSWFSEVSNTVIDHTFGEKIESFSTLSENGLIKTITRKSENSSDLQSFIDALNDINSEYYNITKYCSDVGIKVDISGISEL